MKKIYVATKIRGFLLELFNDSGVDAKFIWRQGNVYETNSNLKLLLGNLVKSGLGDHLGLIQRIKVKNNTYDIAFSYNRFLNTKKKYIIYLENPTALFHYCLKRNNTYLGRIKIQKYLSDPALHSIICMSNACYKTLSHFYAIPNNVNVKRIYPLVSINPHSSIEVIKLKSARDIIKCLYISSNFNLKGGREIVEAFKILRKKGIKNIHLEIVTKMGTLSKQILGELDSIEGVYVNDFNYTKRELQQVYNDSNILLHPTRQDSFSLVVLEAMKAGNVILATDLYAIPEMVTDGFNGFLTSPRYRFYNYNNLPNPEVWNNRGETIHSDYIDVDIVDFLVKKLQFLNDDRSILEQMAINSFRRASGAEFSREYIINEWNSLLNQLK